MELDEFNGLDIVLVAGLPASGKTVFSRRFFGETDRKRINRKELQRALYEMTGFGRKWTEKDFSVTDENLVKHVERKTVEHMLQNRQKILIDNSSISRSSRSTYLSIATQAHKTIGVIFLNPPVNVCLERNRQKEDPIPETVISNLVAKLELPTESEGFKKVLIVRDF